MINVPKSFQDYDDDDPQKEFRQARWDFWKVLKVLREDYLKEQTEFHAEDFVEWVRSTYGFALELNATGITDNYIIVDEKKYIVFKLKYG
jgi:DNA polymerase elongation subunit (family B)